MYDVSAQPTFDCLPVWLREVEEYASPKVLRVLVGEKPFIKTQFKKSNLLFLGNKVDRDDREIPPAVGEAFSRMNNMYFIETSAKDCSNVDKLFQEIARELIQVQHFPRFQQFLKISS